MKKKCTVCNKDMSFIRTNLVLKKYKVLYFKCRECGIIQTEEPYWLDEAYSSAIVSSDTGLLQRNSDLSRELLVFLYLFLDTNGKFVDYAGGYGVLVRLMRDLGLDFYWSDPYCQNIFARGFESEQLEINERINAITAFEVLEHVYNPIDFIDKLLSRYSTNTLIFSTELFHSDIPNENWWYYGFSQGQHITFYNAHSLKYISRIFGFNYLSIGGLHVFTRNPVEIKKFKVLIHSNFKKMFSRWLKGKLKSRTFSDHIKLTKK